MSDKLSVCRDHDEIPIAKADDKLKFVGQEGL